MAKAPSKTPAKTTAKKAPSNPKAKAVTLSIDTVCEEALLKLKELNLDMPLQRDIEWCLGSYKADKNPAGLYEMAEKSLKVFKAAKENKTKGITTKLIGDIEKALQSR